MSKPGFRPDPAVAARRERVLALRIEQVPYTEIAKRLGTTVAIAKADYSRALDQLQADQAATAGRAREMELAKLDLMEQAVWVVLRKRHVTVSNGKLIYLEDTPLEDDAPVLQAVDRLVKIAARRATLTGMDAPARIEVSDATDQAIRALAAELAGGLGDVEPGRETAPARSTAGRRSRKTPA